MRHVDEKRRNDMNGMCRMEDRQMRMMKWNGIRVMEWKWIRVSAIEVVDRKNGMGMDGNA